MKQVLEAQQAYPEAPFAIDGADTASIFFVGQVHNISSQTTNVTYKVDDGTGEIEVKHWVDSTSADPMDMGEEDSREPEIKLNGYIKAFGKLKSFGNKRYVGAHCLRPVTDVNEVNCHFLQATAIHLFFTRGPPGGASGKEDGEYTNGIATNGAVANGSSDYGMDQTLPPMSAVARRVFHFLRDEPQSNEGLHVQLISAKMSLPMASVTSALSELHSASLVFSTVDDYTWAYLGC